MKKVMLFFAVAVIALGVNAQGEKKAETKPAAKKETAKPAEKKADKPAEKKADKPAEKKADKK
jgi:uncharacterized membrane protein